MLFIAYLSGCSVGVEGKGPNGGLFGEGTIVTDDVFVIKKKKRTLHAGKG